MPAHVYVCGTCENKFEELRQYGSDVSSAACPRCLNHASKSYEHMDLMAASIPDMDPYYEEQLGKWISGRRGLREAVHDVDKASDGKVKPEWH